MAVYTGGSITITTLILTVILLAGCSGGVSEEERYQSALTSYSNQEFSKAIIELKNLLQANGKHQAGRILLAKTYLQQGDGIAAEKEINSINEAEKADPEVKQMVLDAWRLQGKYKQIVEHYEADDFTALEQRPLIQTVANAYIHLRQPEKADNLAETLLETDAGNADALVVRAKAASMRDRDEQAIDFLNKAIVLDGENPQAWRTLGGIQSKLQQFDQAIESLKRAVSLDRPDDSKQERFLTQTSLIQLLILKSRFTESKQYLGELKSEFSSHPIVIYLSGLHNYIDKKYDLAKTELTDVHNALPNHLPTVLLLGATHFAENNLEQANVLLSRYVNQVPTHLQARKLLGEIKLRLNKPEEALSILKSSSDQQKDHQLLSMIGAAASQSGDFLQGVEYLKKAAKSHPENTQIRQELAKLYLNQGAVDDAIAELEQMDSTSGKSTTNLLILSYLKKQDLAAARNKSDQVFTDNQNLSATDYYLRAVIELQSGNRHAAREHLRNAVEVNRAYVPALVALGRMDLEDGRLSEGSDRLDLVLATDPENTHALLLLAQISERSGQQREALKWIDRAATSSRNPILPIIIVSRYYLRTKQPEKAARYLQNKALLETENLTILSLIAEMNQQSGNYQQAGATIERMIRLNPQNQDAYLQLADLQRKQGDYAAAMSTLDGLNPLPQKGKLLKYKLALQSGQFDAAEAVAKQLSADSKSKYLGVALSAGVLQAKGRPQSAISLLKKNLTAEAPFYLYRKLADLYAMNGNVNAASEVLQQRIESQPGGDKQAKLALAMILQTNEKPEDAIKLYDELLSDEPDNVIALNNAALLVYEKNPEKGLDFARRAYDRVGDSSLAVIDTYAWLTFREGDSKSALNLLEPIIHRATDPSIRYHYAAVLKAQGRNKEAREILQAILDNNQQFEESSEAKQLLSELSSANG
ncbi:MAG: PEP-CTERM system TPR-repeat protein PrsT [Candidatus Thiodiazotropha weberae]|nr:PEP-CTERM system TPR-repeat protein PrsT [Candidatus Thiodiazotropha weberae]